MDRKVIIALICACLSLAAQIPQPSPSGGGGGSGGGSPDPCSQSISALPSGLHCNTVTLTQANILALQSTPFTLVPAPGAGLVLFPFAVRWRLNFVSQPYCEPHQGGAAMWWSDNTNPFDGLAFGPDLGFFTIVNLSSTAAFFGSGSGPQVSADPATYTNVPLVIQTYPGDSFNCGTVLTAAVAASGTGYKVGDQFKLPQSDGDNSALFTVSSIGGGGAVTGITITDPGVAEEGGTAIPAVNVGNVTSATVTGGHAGSGYANGDTGTISGCGDGTATYTVLTSSGGAVNTVSVSGGTGYFSPTGCTTTVSTGGGDGALQLNVSAGAGNSLTVTITVQAGDGTLLVTTWYTVAAP